MAATTESMEICRPTLIGFRRFPSRKTGCQETGFPPGGFLGEGAFGPLYPRGETGGFPGDLLGNGRSAHRSPSEKLEDLLTLRRPRVRPGKVQMA